MFFCRYKIVLLVLFFSFSVVAGPTEDLLKGLPGLSVKEVNSLIEAGADVHAKNNKGETPLFWANAEVARVLIEAGAEVDAKNNKGETPLFWANAEVARVLIEAGAEVDAKNNKGETPLHWANWANAEVARALIEAGANIHAKNNKGETPLHWVFNAEVARVLIEAGANILAKNNKGETPLQNVTDSKVIRVFIEEGVNVNVRDHENNRSYHIRRRISAQKLRRPSSKVIVGCEYSKDPLIVTSNQFGNRNICAGNIQCKFQISEGSILNRNYQAFCEVLENNKCPSATHCAISMKVLEKRGNSDEILSPRSSKKYKTRGV